VAPEAVAAAEESGWEVKEAIAGKREGPVWLAVRAAAAAAAVSLQNASKVD
jgi:hypothetical protein